jgi:hypothetical protein
VIHDEALTPGQIAGGLLVIAAVIWVQLQRISHEDEAAPLVHSERTPSLG